ncbi:hypothetical protein [Spiroplasma endosymbiont of Dasysyrphus albostriatus]|uniref:hypothetical protein n=1 Tax=Spiroplasma endosymbiont of Dasysyrphus albostriatus TaxID=3066299 RepID=UPI0030D3A592
MEQKYWWKLKKGTGIRVKIINDIDKETGKQKYHPAIVIKSYPSHVKVQLLSTQPNKDDYYKIIANNKIAYVRPIYYVTVSFNLIQSLWFEKGKIVYINPNSVFFQKIIEMEYKEIFDKELNLKEKENKDLETKIKELENKVQEQDKEIQELKKKICMQTLKLKNRNHG